MGGVNPDPTGESGVGCAASGLGAEALRLDLDKALFILPPPPPPPPNPEEPDISRGVDCGGASCLKRLPPKVAALFMDCSLFDTWNNFCTIIPDPGVFICATFSSIKRSENFS